MPEQKTNPVGEQNVGQAPQQKDAPAAEPALQHIGSATGAKTVSDILQSVQIVIDTYDDIFSDFDPSPYATRVLSDDFLAELRKRYAETKGEEIVVHFTIPSSGRSERTEAIVKKRLKDYFRTQHMKLGRSIGDIRMRGLLRIVIGAVVLTVAFMFASNISLALENLLMVPSWFLLWSGFDALLDAPVKLASEMRFSERFMKTKYNFVSEEELLKSMAARSSYV